jgi:hypothetical protein
MADKVAAPWDALATGHDDAVDLELHKTCAGNRVALGDDGHRFAG